MRVHCKMIRKPALGNLQVHCSHRNTSPEKLKNKLNLTTLSLKLPNSNLAHPLSTTTTNKRHTVSNTEDLNTISRARLKSPFWTLSMMMVDKVPSELHHKTNNPLSMTHTQVNTSNQAVRLHSSHNIRIKSPRSSVT
jgi:hypothetical protein